MPAVGRDHVETTRLTLRHFREADVDALYEIQRDEDAMRYTFCSPSRAESERRLRAYAALLEELGYAPWTVVEATQGRFARVKVFETVIRAVETELERRRRHPAPKPEPMPKPVPSPTGQEDVLDRVDLSLSLDRKTYEEQLDQLQERLFRLEHERFVDARARVVHHTV